MSLESELLTRLAGYSALTAIVSTRIYNTLLPEDVAFPAVVFQRISTSRTSAFGADTGDIQARVQVDIYADRARQSDTTSVGAQVRGALQRYKGGNIQDIRIEDERHDYIGEAEMWRVSIDLMIWFKEA